MHSSLLLSVCYWMIKLHYTSIWTSTVQYHMTTHSMDSWTLSPAVDLSVGQDLSITVPHGHSRSFAAAQTTQEGGRCFLLACRLSLCASLCQVLLRSIPAHSLDVASLLIIYCTTRPSDLFISLLLFSRGEGETDGLHAVDFHKRQVELRQAWDEFGQAVFELASPALV